MTSESNVLLLEDEAIIALDLQWELQSSGWTVIGPALNLKRAYELLSKNEFGTAILDINIGPDTSFEFARACKEKGVRIIFISGQSNGILPTDLTTYELLRKPIQPKALISLLK